jgi:hypothetical protein
LREEDSALRVFVLFMGAEKGAETPEALIEN